MRRSLLSLAVVVAVAAGVRVAHFESLRGGPLLSMDHWAESDMAFFKSWARGIAAGDFLSRDSGPPAHSWHDNFARRIHEKSGSAEPYGPEVRRRIWNRWLGGARFYQDPLYPYALAASFAIFGDSTTPVLFVQALLGIGSAVLVWLLARRLFGDVAALASGLMAALFGPLLLHELLLLRESALTFTALATLLAGTVALGPTEKRIWPVVAGALTGVLVLIKSSALLLFAAFVLLLLHRLRATPREAVARAGLCLAAFAAILAPLAARNLAVGVPPLALPGEGPVTFINHNIAGYDPLGGDAADVRGADILDGAEGRFFPAAVATIRTHASVGAWLRLVAGKLAAFSRAWEVPNNESYDYYRLSLGPLAWPLVGFPLVAPLAVVGISLSGFRSHAHALLLAHLGAALFLTAVFFHLSRYRVPVAMAMLPFAGGAVAAALDALRDRRWKPLLLGGSLLVVVAALVLRPLPPDRPRIRLADFGTANEITEHLVAIRASEGDVAGAMALLDRQLLTEPAPLRNLRPEDGVTSLPVQAALLAGSFRPLHEMAADLCARLGRLEETKRHARAEELLGQIERQVEAAKANRSHFTSKTLPASAGAFGV
ncbi:MAG TPA: glycosyltransferase family 39 protein [Verrucomicrobiae bacterium]|nr:glycosyltransferase family 39 protein [Verrucomicrobiae bacterium]